MKTFTNEYFDRADSATWTVGELIIALKKYPYSMPVLGAYGCMGKGIYGSVVNPQVEFVEKGRKEEYENCLVFDIEYEDGL